MSTPFWHDDHLTLYGGDCRDVLPTMPAESVHCVVTSPPYWGLRDYGAAGQLGLEPTPEEYVANMVAVFREVRRVLRADGTLWLNLGDSYNNRSVTRRSSHQKGLGFTSDELETSWRDMAAQGRATLSINGGPYALKEKDLVGIPWRVAFALQADGWYLRSDIIWAKPNPMPESVTDRPTKAHEYLFLLSKSARYYYDADAVREPLTPETIRTSAYALGPVKLDASRNDAASLARFANPSGRNLRSVWTIATEPYPMVKLPNGVGPDGTPDRVSPDCPVHSPQATRRTPRTGANDGQPGPDPSRSRDNGTRPALAPASALLASSSPDSQGVHPAMTGSPDLGSSGSPTPGSAPESRTPSLPTVDGGPGATAGPEDRTNHSPGSPTSQAGDVTTGADAATRRNGSESRTTDGSSALGSSARSTADRRPDTDAASGAPEGRCSCPKYISTSHFATFPRKLVEPCVKAGTSERGVCPECGASWERVVERESTAETLHDWRDRWPPTTPGHNTVQRGGVTVRVTTTGWRPSCAHDAEPAPATVLDPFAGSGTTLLVAQALGRRGVGIDLNPEYLQQALARNAQTPLGLLA